MSAVIHFSTDDIAPHHRLAVWHEAVFQSEFNVDIEPILEVPFRAGEGAHIAWPAYSVGRELAGHIPAQDKTGRAR
jgi:hypothetical protein